MIDDIDDLKRALADHTVHNVLLSTDCPGGAVERAQALIDALSSAHSEAESIDQKVHSGSESIVSNTVFIFAATPYQSAFISDLNNDRRFFVVKSPDKLPAMQGVFAGTSMVGLKLRNDRHYLKRKKGRA